MIRADEECFECLECTSEPELEPELDQESDHQEWVKTEAAARGISCETFRKYFPSDEAWIGNPKPKRITKKKDPVFNKLLTFWKTRDQVSMEETKAPELGANKANKCVYLLS